MVALQQFDIEDDWARIIEAVDEDGGVIVTNFLSRSLHQTLLHELSPHADQQAPGMEGGDLKKYFAGAQTKRFSGLAARAAAFANVIDHDLLHIWAEHGFATDYWMNTGQAMVVGPGSDPQFLHRDADNWPIAMALGADGPEATLSAMIALTEFTSENGATHVVPGSHRWQDFKRTSISRISTRFSGCRKMSGVQRVAGKLKQITAIHLKS